MNFLGLDIGTTGCKALIFDRDGALLGQAMREYAVDFPQPHWAEQDLEAVWVLAEQAITEALAGEGIDQLDAISLSVHGEAVTPVDSSGRAIRPAILGMDTRTGPQNAWLEETIGAKELFRRTGMPIHTINTLPKLLWLKENEPDTWKRADQFLLVEDFIIRRMTGKAYTSTCLASRSQMLNIETAEWDTTILDTLDLDPARLGCVLPSGKPAGELSRELSEKFGLSNLPVVVAGGHDQACGALGAGLVSPGLAMVSTGTAEVVEVVMAEPILSSPLLTGNISVYRHVVPDLFLAMTLNHSGGMVLRWFRDEFCELQVKEAEELGEDAYDLILSGASAVPTGLLVLPHFSGSGTPTFDTASKGAVLGLTFAAKRADFARAILEGLTYELQTNLELLQEGGVEINVLRAIGGGAKSRTWLQMKADITGIPVVVPRITEAAGFGAALLAGVGAGAFPSVSEAVDRFQVLETRYEPDHAQSKQYARLYELYRKVYPAVSSISHAL